MSEFLPQRPVARLYRAEDMHVRSDGSGRVVESYFASFGAPSEVTDVDGHYYEANDRTAFNRTLAGRAVGDWPVYFQHGRTIDGTPAGEFSLPIAVPLEITPDERGMFNAVKYIEGDPLADRVLRLIKNGAVRHMSYSGHYLRSQRGRERHRGLPVIVRQEIRMREFGPTPIPAHRDAEILGVRAQFLRALLGGPDSDVAEWLQNFEGQNHSTRLDPDSPRGTPYGPAATADDPVSDDHSSRPASLRMRIHAARIARGITE